MKTVIGIDPGTKGGIATMFEDGEIIVEPYSPANLKRRLSTETDEGWDTQGIRVYIENVHSMPKQGLASTFAFGKNFGIILGIVYCYVPAYKISYVNPQVWKKEFGLINRELDKKQKKQMSIAKAKELFPCVNLLPTHRCKKDSDGMAESLLIAEYGRRDSNLFNVY